MRSLGIGAPTLTHLSVGAHAAALLFASRAAAERLGEAWLLATPTSTQEHLHRILFDCSDVPQELGRFDQRVRAPVATVHLAELSVVDERCHRWLEERRATKELTITPPHAERLLDGGAQQVLREHHRVLRVDDNVLWRHF